jgi:hypothetical protein
MSETREELMSETREEWMSETREWMSESNETTAQSRCNLKVTWNKQGYSNWRIGHRQKVLRFYFCPLTLSPTTQSLLAR